jgi:hypothetical protein
MDKQRHEDCRHGRGSKFQDAVLLGCRRTRGKAAEDEHEEKPDGRRNEEGIPADYQHACGHHPAEALYRADEGSARLMTTAAVTPVAVPQRLDYAADSRRRAWLPTVRLRGGHRPARRTSSR